MAAEKSREKILARIATNPALRAAEPTDRIGITRKGTQWQIRTLKNAGRFERIGPDRGGRRRNDYLDRFAALARRIRRPETDSSYPPSINIAALRALFDNLADAPESAAREPSPPRYGGGGLP